MHPSSIRYTVVQVPVRQDIHRGDLNSGPQDLLPWADPYIAALMRRHLLQYTAEMGDARAEASPPVSGDAPLKRLSRRTGF